MSDAKRTDYAQIIARLSALIATRHAFVRADPIPALEAAEAQLGKQHHLIMQIHDALTGSDLIFDAACELGLLPTNINGEAYIRNQAALKLIDNYLK